MSGMEKDQLEALRGRVEEDFRRAEEDFRQAEENYRLDMAAIEHLKRRFFGAVNGNSNGNYSAPSNGSNSDSPTAEVPPKPTQAGPQNDDLVGSLRSMFNATSHK